MGLMGYDRQRTGYGPSDHRTCDLLSSRALCLLALASGFHKGRHHMGVLPVQHASATPFSVTSVPVKAYPRLPTLFRPHNSPLSLLLHYFPSYHSL